MRRRTLDRLRTCDLERDETQGVLRERIAEAQAALAQAIGHAADAWALQRSYANLNAQGRGLAAAVGEQRPAVVRDLAALLNIARGRGLLPPR